MERSLRCPGQDQRFWRPEDIHFVPCPSCHTEIEFWKDEPFRFCPACRREIRNPHVDFGCAKWCKQAHECLGALPEHPDQMGTICERILATMKVTWGEGHPHVAAAETAMRSRPDSADQHDPAFPALRAAAMVRGWVESAPDQTEVALPQLLHQAGLAAAFINEVLRVLQSRPDERNADLHA
jgi:hypothetical protein